MLEMLCLQHSHSAKRKQMNALNEKNKLKHAASVIKSRIKYTSEMKLEIDATEATEPFSEVTFDCLNLHFRAVRHLPRALFRRYVCLYLYYCCFLFNLSSCILLALLCGFRHQFVFSPSIRKQHSMSDGLFM